MGGSGKTHFCKEIEANHRAKAFSDATLTSDDHRRAGFDTLGEMVARLVGRKEDCVMDESHLTVASFRDKFKRFCDEFLCGIEQKWFFFERDILACINNVYHDSQRGRESLGRLEALLNQSRIYQVPAAGSYPGFEKAVPVFKQSSPRFPTLQEAEQWLKSQVTRQG
jgi:hypothetical protein